MITTVLCDMSYVLIFPRSVDYNGKLNDLHQSLNQEVNYQPLDHFFINNDLIHYFSTIKEGMRFVLFTAGSMHQVSSIKHHLDAVFDEYLTERAVGLSKTDPQAFHTVAKMLHTDPSKILFIDDKLENTRAAQMAGLSTVQFQSNNQLKEEMSKIFTLSK